MSDKRDRRQVHTPPQGVKAQLAPSAGEEPEDWEGKHSHTPVHLTPVDQPTIPESIEQASIRRQKETKNAAVTAADAGVAAATASTTTLDGLRDLRKEYREDVHALREDLRHTNGRLDIVADKAGQSVAQNEILIELTTSILEEQRIAKQQSGQIKVVERTITAEVHGAREKSEIEVGKAEALASIDAQKAEKLASIDIRKAKWSALIEGAKELGVKGAIAVGGGIAALVATGIGIGQCGGS